MKIDRQIIATSGGFAIEPRNKRIDKYILSQVNSKTPKICFIGTASGDSKNYINRYYHFFKNEKCIPNHLDLFRGNIINIEKFLLDQDIIYVGGGNSRNMLSIWKDRGLDKILGMAYNKGVLMCGISAGSLCWFEQGLTDSIPGKFTAMNCLGFIKGSNCPFLNMAKKKAYLKLIKSKKIKDGIATEIGVAIHYKNEVIHRVVSSRKNCHSYFYVLVENKIQKKKLFQIFWK